MMFTVNYYYFRTFSTICGMDDRPSVNGLVKFLGIIGVDSDTRKGAWTTYKEDSGKDSSSNLDSLPLIRVYCPIQDLLCVVEEIEVIVVNHPFLLGKNIGA